jgi:hypothetical protein
LTNFIAGTQRPAERQSPKQPIERREVNPTSKREGREERPGIIILNLIQKDEN